MGPPVPAARRPQGEDQGRRGRGRRRAAHGRVPARSLTVARRPHRGRRGPAAGAQRAAAAGARVVHDPPEARRPARPAPQGARRGRPHRLGPGRGARDRVARHRGDADPAHRPGLRARHVLAAAHGPARREDRADVQPDPAPRRGQGAVRAAQLAASEIAALGFEYGYSAEAPGARHVGGAVRRLRQQRAGHLRPVHRLRPGQVGPDHAADDAAAARLRGLGSRALQRAPRAVPAARGRGQHPRRQPHDAGADVPPHPAPGEDPQAAPADHHDAEVAAAAAAGVQPDRAPLRDAVLPRPRRAVDRRGQGHPADPCTGKIYYDLVGHSQRENNESVAVGRVELLYPFPEAQLVELLATYPNLEEVVWVQEEPRNMGARAHMGPRLMQILPEHLRFGYVGRPERASTGGATPPRTSSSRAASSRPRSTSRGRSRCTRRSAPAIDSGVERRSRSSSVRSVTRCGRSPRARV